MFKQVIIATSLMTMPFACSSDEQEAEDVVEMPAANELTEATEMPAMPEAPSVEEIAAAANPPANADTVGYVRTAVLRVRSGPGLSHKTVGYVTFNQEVPLNPEGMWSKIAEGQWVSNKYLSKNKNSKQWIPAH